MMHLAFTWIFQEKTRKELEELRSGAESLRESLSLAEHANATVEERHAAEKETLEKKVYTIEHNVSYCLEINHCMTIQSLCAEC